MILRVQPAESLSGRVRLPASKSYSIRAFIIAACGGRSHVIHPSECEDAKVALRIARNLGAIVKMSRQKIFNIQAHPRRIKATKITVGESGTVLRFVLPLLSARLRSEAISVTGEGTLVGRPNRHLLNTLRSCGIQIHGEGFNESVPIQINLGTLQGGPMKIDGSLSSQFISSLLIACPGLRDDSDIILTGKNLVSSDYIIMTIQILRQAGIKIRKISSRHYQIPGQQKFLGLKHFEIPSDYGLAAFLMAAASLIPSDVVLQGAFHDRFIQADGQILKFLKQMGVKWRRTSDALTMKGPFDLRGGTFSLKNCPDLVPIMAVLGLFARGGVRLVDIGHARAKESDRISDLRQELVKVGARVVESRDSLKIDSLMSIRKGAILNPHRDHRLAMAFAVLGLKIGATVKDMDCVKKSYPSFVRDMKALHAPFH